MATIETYTFTTSDIEEICDTTKITIIKALVSEGYLDSEEAEKWCAEHTIIVRKKTFFRTITSAWKKAKEVLGLYFMCVKEVGNEYNTCRTEEPINNTGGIDKLEEKENEN